MTKITLIISKYLPEYTGAAYRIDRLYSRLNENYRDIEVEVICNSTSETKSVTYTHNGYNVRRIVFPWKLSWLPARLKNAIKSYYEAIACFYHLRQVDADMLHIVGSSGGTSAALLYGSVKKIPRLIELVTCEATPYQYLPLLRYPKLLKLKEKSIIIAISQKLRNDCYSRGLIDNVWCRPNPINEKKFYIDKSEKLNIRRNISPFSEHDIVITMVAKFMPQKSQLFILKAIRYLPNNYKLLLAGPRSNNGIFKKRDDQYFNTIQEYIKTHGLKDRVCINDEFVDASAYMKASDVYMMPQHTEGLGTPMLEAIACGIPVIANSEEPAFKEWIVDGVNGYLCEKDEKKWADTIVKALKIKPEVLEQSSENIHYIASTKKCDKQYRNIITTLSDTNSNKELNINDIF